MQIAYKKFVQLTALLAAGSIAPACVTSDTDDNSSSGGTSNQGSGGGSATGGASAQGGAVENAAGTSASSAAGSSAHAEGTAGSSTAGSSGAGNSAPVAGSGGQSDGVAGNSGVAGGSIAGASFTGGTHQCVPAGDPAEEGEVNIDCSQLPFANVSCGPSAEGLTTYGRRLCYAFSSEPKAAAEALFNCLSRLVAPSEGWCGDAHAAQVESCLSTVAAGTCVTSAAATACAAIHDRCNEVSASECRAKLSMRSEAAVASVDPCMEGVGYLSCSASFEYCSDLPERMLDTTETCAKAIAVCPTLTSASCAHAFWDSDYVYERMHRNVNLCWDAAVTAGSPCDEAFTDCASRYYGS